MTLYSKLNKFLLYIFLYFFIYAPPFSFLPINISLILSLFCILIIFKKSFISYSKLFKDEILILYLMVLYVIGMTIYTQQIRMYDPVILLFFKVPTVFFIYHWIRKSNRHNSYDELINSLIIISSAASIISILLWLYPEVNEYVKFTLLKYDQELLRYQLHRGYALSDEQLFSFSIVQATILLLVIENKGINIKTVTLACLILISISLNARIGFLIALLAIFIPSKQLSKKIILTLTVIIISIYSSVLFSKYELFTFIVDTVDYFYKDITSFGSGDSVLDALFGRMLFIPDTYTHLFFGNGKAPINSNNEGSDIGFIILLHYGGLLYLSLVVIFILLCFYKGLQAKRVVVITILSLVFLISNFKGLFFAAKPGMNLFLTVYIVMYISTFTQKIKESRNQN